VSEAWKTLEKDLPSVTLDEGFVDCDTRQKRLGELYIGNGFFVEYFLSGFAECRSVLDKEMLPLRRQVTASEPMLTPTKTSHLTPSLINHTLTPP
jgi:hypothetical protein